MGGFATEAVAASENDHPVVKESAKVGESVNREFFAITLTKGDTDEVAGRFLGTIGKTDGDVTILKVGKRTYDMVKSEGIGSVSADVVSQGEGVIERSEQVSDTTGDCGVYDGYDHQFKGFAVEFEQRVNDIGLTTAAAALTTVISSAGWSVVVITAGALLALVTTEDSVTVGYNEVDTVFSTVANYKQVIAIGYDVTNESNFMSPGDTVIPPGHPFR